MADTPRRPRIPTGLALTALVTAAGWPITRLFREGGAGEVVLLSAVLSLTVAWGARRLRVPVLLRVVVSAFAFIWFVTVRFAPETSWGPFPSLHSFSVLRALLHEGSRVIMQDAAPVPADAGVLLYVTAGVWVTGWLVDTAFALGNPLLAVGSAIPLFLAPGSLVPSQSLAFEAVLFLAAASWVLFTDERGRAVRRSSGVAPKRAARRHPGWSAVAAAPLALAAMIFAVAFPPHMPGFGATPYLRAHGPGAHIGFNPIVAIKPTLSQAPNRILMRVRTRTPGYYRLTELDDFDGKVWKPRAGRLIDVSVGDPPPIQATSQFVRQDYLIDALVGAWLPAVYAPISIEGPDDLRYEVESRALLSDELHTGLRYTVFSRVPNLTAEELETTGGIDERALHDYLTLPRSTPAKIKEIASEIAGSQPTEYRRALALQNYLRTFRYDQKVAAGHSFSTIVEFLTKTKRGYCEQFAASMAVLARSLGIPSRVVIGFATGDRQGDTYVVRTKHAHAWVELYFPGYDWVQFEPTPRSGIVTVPSYAQPLAGEVNPGPSANPSTAPLPSASATTDPTKLPKEPSEASTGSTGGPPAWLIAVIAIGAALVLLAMLPFVQRTRLRRRAHHAPSARDAIAMRYVDFLSWCRTAGFEKAPGETPREHAARVATGAPAAREQMEAVAVLADQALWAPPNGLVLSEFDAVVAAARAGIAPGLPRWQRWIARWRWGH